MKWDTDNGFIDGGTGAVIDTKPDLIDDGGSAI
jgi:hypothetical protein